MKYAARLLLILLVAPVLAGCFESKTSLYKRVTPLRPFHDGAVFTTVDKGMVEHTVAHEGPPGSYKLVGEDGKTDGPYRFFPLAGMPAGTLVAEVRDTMPCATPRTRRDKMCPVYYYGLWRLTPKGVEVTNPDCSKVKGLAKLRGVVMKGDDTNCDFTRRRTLERALRLTARLPPDSIVTVRQ